MYNVGFPTLRKDSTAAAMYASSASGKYYGKTSKDQPYLAPLLLPHVLRTCSPDWKSSQIPRLLMLHSNIEKELHDAKI